MILANDYLVCGLALRGTSGRYHTYAGNSVGRVLKLENDTTDKNASNEDVVITHWVKSRAICADPEKSTTFEFTFRRLWIEAKARASGSITTYFYKNLCTDTNRTTLATPEALSLADTDYNMVTPGLNASQGDCSAFQLEFRAATADLELEIWSFLYQVEAVGEIEL